MSTEHFWQQKSLAELSQQEWESLCDGCGKCCLVKLEDEDDGQVYYTNVACRYLHLKTCQCKNYKNRLALVPDCISLTPDKVDEFQWLPQTCAYRLVSEGKPLPKHHPLISGKKGSMGKAKATVKGRVIPEDLVHPDALEEHVIYWVN